jgi:CheY-like chemotaxis protein
VAPDAEIALTLLQEAVDTEFRTPYAFRTEDALDPLRNHDDFRLVMMDVDMPTDAFAAVGRETTRVLIRQA